MVDCHNRRSEHSPEDVRINIQNRKTMNMLLIVGYLLGNNYSRITTRMDQQSTIQLKSVPWY